MQRRIIDSFIGPYEFLSNFHPVNVALDGDIYPSVEHAYQAAKTNDIHKRARIRSAGTAAMAKAVGRGLPLRKGWHEERVGVMRELLLDKFVYPDLRERLLATGDAELIEGNWWGDEFWGVCRGKGQNQLGKLLMEIRSGCQHIIPYG